MAIESDRSYVSGKPRLVGTRLTVGHIVNELNLYGYEEFFEMRDYLTEADLQEVLNYCRSQQCDGAVHVYCQHCTKDKTAYTLDDPGNNTFFLGEVSIEQVLAEWDTSNKRFILGSKEAWEYKENRWEVAEQLYQEYFGSKEDPNVEK